jgi:K+-sensing histidine kinase KdpD
MESNIKVQANKQFWFINTRIRQYIFSIIVIGGTIIFCTPLANTESYHLVSFILLFVVSFLATLLSLGPVLLASTFSALAWNFFFIPPQYTFHIDRTDDILIFGMFFIIAMLNGVLNTRVRRQEKLVRERESRTNALLQLTKELSRASGMDEIKTTASVEIRRHFFVEPVLFFQDGIGNLQIPNDNHSDSAAMTHETDIPNWVFKNMQKAGAHTDNFSDTDYTYFPLSGTRLNPGVLAIKLDRGFSGDQSLLWDAFLVQVSNALEREFLGELAQKARFLNESDRLYKTLFNSISHEFRIPVATIMGASDTLLNEPHPDHIQTALHNEIFTASVRLNRLIENLLNMSRLESGFISLRLDWQDLNDLINKVANDLKDELEPFSLIVTIPDDMPLIRIDYGLMEQVLYNLLINAALNAPAHSEIMLSTYHNFNVLTIEIADQGLGFPEDNMSDVFNKFYRINGSKTGGLGLGLSIAKGFIEAHNGTISVENRDEGGSKFTIKIPSENPDIDNFQFESL